MLYQELCDFGAVTAEVHFHLDSRVATAPTIEELGLGR